MEILIFQLFTWLSTFFQNVYHIHRGSNVAVWCLGILWFPGKVSLLWRGGELSGTFFVSFSLFLLSINFLRRLNGPLPTVMRMEEVPCRYWEWLNFGFYAPMTSCFRGWLWMPSAPMLLTCASWKLIKLHVPRLGMSFKRVCWTIHCKSRCTWSSNVCKWNTEDGCVSRTTEADCGNTRLEAGLLFRCPSSTLS